MKYNELNNYKVICNIAADDEKINNRPSGAGDDLLSDYVEDLKELFGPDNDKEVDIDEMVNCLKSKHEYISYIELIK